MFSTATYASRSAAYRKHLIRAMIVTTALAASAVVKADLTPTCTCNHEIEDTGVYLFDAIATNATVCTTHITIISDCPYSQNCYPGAVHTNEYGGGNAAEAYLYKGIAHCGTHYNGQYGGTNVSTVEAVECMTEMAQACQNAGF